MDLIELLQATQDARAVDARAIEFRSQHQEIRRIERLEHALIRARTPLDSARLPPMTLTALYRGDQPYFDQRRSKSR